MSYTPGDFDMEHVLIQWGGTLPGGEQWSCSMRTGAQASVGGSDVPDESDVASWLAGSIKDAILAYHTDYRTCIHGAAKLTFAKANRIKVDGHYKDAITHEYAFATVGGGGSSGQQLPNQCALAVSLTTGYKRGAAHRGRFYLPLPVVAADVTTGLISSSDASTIAAASKTFIEAIADTPGVDGPTSQTPMVFSRKSGAAAHRKIVGVEVGRVVDTQRRRRRSIKENYVAAAASLGTF